MTNLEAIRANISDAHGVVLTENHFVKALVDVGLTSTGTYASSALIDQASLLLYDNVLIPGANLTEGSLAYGLNIDGLIRARNMLAEKLGETVEKNNAVTGLSVW